MLKYFLSRQSYFPRNVRCFASTAASEKLLLTLCTPYQTFIKEEAVHQVNISSTTGDMGILHKHVPTIQQLKPGIIEIISAPGSLSKKLFLSGGFAIIDKNSKLMVTATEAYPLDAFSLERLSQMTSEAQTMLSKTNSDAEKAAYQIQLDVFSSLKAALSK